jgi:hypothetical protein
VGAGIDGRHDEEDIGEDGWGVDAEGDSGDVGAVFPARTERATPGRMRVVTKATGKPQRGARPTMRSRSGKPEKKRPKKPSMSPGVNQGRGWVTVVSVMLRFRR